MSTELEEVRQIIENSRQAHSLLSEEKFPAGELEYARKLLARTGGEKAVNAAAAVEFVNLGVWYHYASGRLDSHNLIVGDYFYAKALKQISQNQDPEQVRILAQAVMQISANGGQGHRKTLEDAVRLLSERLKMIK